MGLQHPCHVGCLHQIMLTYFPPSLPSTAGGGRGGTAAAGLAGGLTIIRPPWSPTIFRASITSLLYRSGKGAESSSMEAENRGDR